MIGFIIGAVVTVVLIAAGFGIFCVGFYVASEDVKNILSGRKSVDDFWRKRGLK